MAASSKVIENHILFLAAGLLFLAGFLINVFIVAVNISGWKKGRPVSTADKVITSLGISRMVFQVVCLLNVIRDIYFNRLRFLSLPATFLDLTSVYSEIWLSTLLSAIFFFKISTFHNALFLWMKILVLNRVFHIILVSVVVSISYSLVYCLMVNLRSPHNSTHNTYDNFFIAISGNIFLKVGPFLICFIFSSLLIIYLYHHMNRMRSKRNGTSHLDPYYKTIKFAGFSIFCSAAYNLTDQITYWFEVINYSVLYILWQIPLTLHSIYLIYVMAKLRIQVSNMIHFFGRKYGEPEAQVETIFQ